MTTAAQYAEVLVRLVREAIADGLDCTEVSSWTQLHDVCDANEFLIDADTELGVDPWERADDDDFDTVINAYHHMTNAAVAIAEKALWGAVQSCNYKTVTDGHTGSGYFWRCSACGVIESHPTSTGNVLAMTAHLAAAQ